jgi:hypothetical protein
MGVSRSRAAAGPCLAYRCGGVDPLTPLREANEWPSGKSFHRSDECVTVSAAPKQDRRVHRLRVGLLYKRSAVAVVIDQTLRASSGEITTGRATWVRHRSNPNTTPCTGAREFAGWSENGLQRSPLRCAGPTFPSDIPTGSQLKPAARHGVGGSGDPRRHLQLGEDVARVALDCP